MAVTSFAETRARSRLGIAIAAMIPMIQVLNVEPSPGAMAWPLDPAPRPAPRAGGVFYAGGRSFWQDLSREASCSI